MKDDDGALVLRGSVDKLKSCILVDKATEEGAVVATTLFGMVGLFAFEAATKDAENSALVNIALDSFELVDTRTNDVLWKGQAFITKQERLKFWNSPNPYTLSDTYLGEAVDKLLLDLHQELSIPVPQLPGPAGVYRRWDLDSSCRGCDPVRALAYMDFTTLEEATAARDEASFVSTPGYPFLAAREEVGLGNSKDVVVVLAQFQREDRAARWFRAHREMVPGMKLARIFAPPAGWGRRTVELSADEPIVAITSWDDPRPACTLPPRATFIVDARVVDETPVAWAPVRCEEALAYVPRKETRLGATIHRAPAAVTLAQAIRREEGRVELAYWRWENGQRQERLKSTHVRVDDLSNTETGLR